MESILGSAHYLANKPVGAVLAFLIVALVVFAIAGVLAGWAKDIFRLLIVVGFIALIAAFLS